jgi:hypothetical protein
MPTLIINPADDDEFAALVRSAVPAAPDPATLQASLRARYPSAVVRGRELAGDRDIWYVYRDGRWVQSR